MTTSTLSTVNTSLRDEWLQTIRELQDQVKAWVSQEPGWSTELGEHRTIEEKPLGIYTVTSINIKTPHGRLVLEPVARNYPADGIVELFAWPTLYRVRLIHGKEQGGWRIRTDSGIYLRQEWSRDNFIALAKDLVAADA